jgi:uncharacterized protein YbbC (DUF1343 family)
VVRLRNLDLPGIAFRAARFRPEFGKHARVTCSGVELHVVDRVALSPLAVGLHLLQQIHDLHDDHFQWRAEPYEFVGGVPAVDLLTGSGTARDRIEKGLPLDELFDRWRREVEIFESDLDGIVMYREEA